MAKEIDLKKGELSRHVNKAAKAIADGFIIVIPMEHSYAYVCDAFKQDAVRAMHVLRGDPLFTAAQVIVGSVKTTDGIIRETTPEIKALMKKFWPGMLSLNLRPQLGLSWDLGDNNQLDRVASAARKGMAAPKSLSDVWVLESDVALKFDNGNLRKGPISTVIEADETGVRYLREGAISLAEIQAIVPGATGI